eukprot:7650913-Pyramimonas_sp.AAC.1
MAARHAAEEWLAAHPSGAGLQRSITAAARKVISPYPLWNSFVARLSLAFPDMYSNGVSKIPASRWSALS